MKPPTAEDSATPVKPEMSTSGTGSGTPTTVASTSTQTQSQQTPGGGTGSNASNAFGTVKYRIKPPSAAHAQSSSTTTGPPNAGCFIKPSLSLNSLPPQGPHEGSEMAQNRLRIDRPYNSLKKKRDSERELWRRSWGSGHSHSSCSLQSSITTGIGKDDFWAALQTNYNFIMDTNLLDSCREARGEIEGSVVRPREDHMDYYRRAMFKPSPMQTFYGDPRLLRQWIREMEIRISRIPSITETKRLNTEQLLRLSGEHSVSKSQQSIFERR
ncbi:AAEL001313-PA [Aedes aegypti]|uniref:AAEL001313-PA n=1 Tax=Aedes aegypti TaxID=7159 RepID=Q17LM8_AEDAE|nr:AAEL001313-PA [Aedes aegypti]